MPSVGSLAPARESCIGKSPHVEQALSIKSRQGDQQQHSATSESVSFAESSSDKSSESEQSDFEYNDWELQEKCSESKDDRQEEEETM